VKYLCLLLLLVSLPVQARVITACGHPEYPPVSWINNNALIGLAPNVARTIFAELGYQLDIDTSGNWKRCLQEAKAGNIDVVIAAYKTQPRTAYLAYSSQYLVADRLSILVNRNDKRAYHSLQDLKDKRVGLLLGDSFGDAFDQFLNALPEREFVSKGAQNMAKLAYQRIDFMPLGVLSGQLQLHKLGYQDSVKLTEITIGTEHYYLALSKHSGLQKHLPHINQRILALHESGAIEKLLQCFSQYYLDGTKANCHELP
jgi:polar amino acid transport system substrate-binding protein